MSRHAHINCPHVAETDPSEPKGYLEWHVWSEKKSKSGDRQKRCNICGLWFWPKKDTVKR